VYTPPFKRKYSPRLFSLFSLKKELFISSILHDVRAVSFAEVKVALFAIFHVPFLTLCCARMGCNFSAALKFESGVLKVLRHF